jgi:hypothetical protein
MGAAASACQRPAAESPAGADPAPAAASADIDAPAPASVARPSGAPARDPADRVFEPGKHFGAVTRATDEANLRSIYGEGQVKRSEWVGAEGQAQPATVVFEGTPDEFWVLWDGNAFKVPARVMVVGSNWRTREGLHVGSDLAALRAANGGEFAFTGFDWDYGGYVNSWRGGALAGYEGKLSVQLDREAIDEAAEDEQLVGDGVTVVSDNPQLAAQRVTVGRMDIALE